MSRLLRHHRSGQALVFVALVLPVLLMLVLTSIEVSGRYLELAEVEDALRQASRSAVQTFDYAAFAANGQRVRETHATTITGCDGAAPASARRAACTVLMTNLSNVSGLEDSREQTAARVTWTFLPSGGTCSFPNGRPPVTFATPAVCATVQPRLRGLLGWGVWTPQVDAADTLDPLH